MWMLFLSSLCANTGSTGGGIKMFRSLILIKQSLREMFTLVHPQAVAPLKVAGQVVPNGVVYSVLAFIFLYFITIVVLVFALLISGLDFISAFSAIVACINNVGPGLNVVGTGQHLPRAERLSDAGPASRPCFSAASRSSPSRCCLHRRSGANNARAGVGVGVGVGVVALAEAALGQAPDFVVQ